MNALFIASRFATAVSVQQPVAGPRVVARASTSPDAQEARRNRYARRAFGIGYGTSDGYASTRTYLGTPSLSRYR